MMIKRTSLRCVVDRTSVRSDRHPQPPVQRRVPMIKQLVGGLAAAALVVGFSASAHAQCAFPHPKKAASFKSNFVQAFVSCGNAGGNSPNTFAGGGAAPACRPPETFNQQAGSPTNGWVWGPKSQMAIAFKSKNHNVFTTT